VIGLSALVIGMLGLIHIACGSPGRDQGAQALRDAGGLIGWAAASPFLLHRRRAAGRTAAAAVHLFGLLVVTATPRQNAIPERLRYAGTRLGLYATPPDPEAVPLEEFFGDTDEAAPTEDDTPVRRLPPRFTKPPAGADADPYDVDRDASLGDEPKPRRRPRRAGALAGDDDGPDAVDLAAGRRRRPRRPRCCTASSPPRSSPT